MGLWHTRVCAQRGAWSGTAPLDTEVARALVVGIKIIYMALRQAGCGGQGCRFQGAGWGPRGLLIVLSAAWLRYRRAGASNWLWSPLPPLGIGYLLPVIVQVACRALSGLRWHEWRRRFKLNVYYGCTQMTAPKKR